jgi:hypothetical protein
METAPYLLERYTAIVKNILLVSNLDQMGGVLEWIRRCDDEYGPPWLEFHKKLDTLCHQKMEDLKQNNFEDRIYIDHEAETVSQSLGVSYERLMVFNDLLTSEIYPQSGIEKVVKISRLTELILKEARNLQELVLASIMLGSLKETLQKISGKLKKIDIDGPVDDDAIFRILNDED